MSVLTHYTSFRGGPAIDLTRGASPRTLLRRLLLGVNADFTDRSHYGCLFLRRGFRSTHLPKRISRSERMLPAVSPDWGREIGSGGS
jgi:hypothetical protein